MSEMDKKALRTDIRISAFYSQLFHQPPKPSPLLINKKFWYNLNDFELNTTNHSVTRCCCYGISTIVHANPSPYGSKGITCLPRIPNSKERKSFCQAPWKLEFPETFSSHSPQKADFFFSGKQKWTKPTGTVTTFFLLPWFLPVQSTSVDWVNLHCSLTRNLIWKNRSWVCPSLLFYTI